MMVGVIHLTWRACNIVVKASDTSAEHTGANTGDEGRSVSSAISKQIIPPLC